MKVMILRKENEREREGERERERVHIIFHTRETNSSIKKPLPFILYWSTN
jgi:ERCC4-type nuclease